MAVARSGSSEVGTTTKPEEKQGGAGAEPTGGGPRMSKRRFYLLIGLGLAAVAIIAWLLLSGSDVPRGFARGNGRVEANELYVATKHSGRIAEVLFNEGDMVETGQVVARMD